jgi:hypothetical protein
MGRPQLVEIGAAVNATFIGLAFLAALNPKLLAVDLLLIQNTRPRLMLLGGMGIGLLAPRRSSGAPGTARLTT